MLEGSGQIALAMMVMNVATYAFTMSAARIIGPIAYGAFFALMNLVRVQLNKRDIIEEHARRIEKKERKELKRREDGL